jgi:hypothetical protein
MKRRVLRDFLSSSREDVSSLGSASSVVFLAVIGSYALVERARVRQTLQ